MDWKTNARRPANHPHNQMTLPFLEKVFRAQLHNPDAGRFPAAWHSRTVNGRGFRRVKAQLGAPCNVQQICGDGAPNPLKDGQRRQRGGERAELPYKPLFHHQYWFIDIRYLVKHDGQWVYSICIIEGVSRTILAGMSSRHQDEIAILQLLHAAFGDYGLPWGIVSDNASVFTADAFLDVLDGLEIQPCPIEKRQSWQSLIETQFNIQRRLADAKFKQADTFEEIQDQHAAFIQLFNTTRHWAHRDRMDGCLTPISVLAGRLGRSVQPHKLRRVFRQLQFSRVVNRHGYVSVQRFYIYAEQGLAKQRVAVWLYQEQLRVEYQQTLLARYQYRFNRKARKISHIFSSKLYRTVFVSPQLELFELDDQEWQKILHRPEYAKRRAGQKTAVKQLPLALNYLMWLFIWLGKSP